MEKSSGTIQIWPAIDLREGKCVRLEQGDYGRQTTFGDDPARVAAGWVAQGAQQLHLVDLDGARDGQLANREAIQSILAAAQVPCQLGGGIRDATTIADLLDLGLSRLILGTQALKQPDWFRRMSHEFPGRLAVGIDARGGRVATDGWLEESDTDAVELARRLEDLPLACIIYTDIARDGMMAGPNLAAIRTMCEATSLPVIASGGVTTADDVVRLAGMGVAGCIIGRSLYEGKLTIAQALRASVIRGSAEA